MKIKRFLKQLFCWHRYDKFLGYDYYNPISHGLKRPKYMCRCGAMKFKKEKDVVR
jgi:hypothetical protein